MAPTAHPTALRRASPVILPPRSLTLVRIAATSLVGAVMFLLASGAPSPAAAEGTTEPEKGVCGQPAHAAATPPAQGAHSGTAPGGAGSTGWSGGTGGSFIGTTPQASTPGSPDRQPEVVKGADPKAEPPKAPC
ncbi:hypothetical protein K9U40_18090 [Xanthobacter autotrophicus]|uniref:hypothetical protein n=1 Tax=Xanthobacter TaxID=279 RepID=UPI0024AC5970|nr:hypothetical protein [Xanthobacter autotrophicus]MDI4666217.1 hypothetical protein [Xanthobacter autotrophicus]